MIWGQLVVFYSKITNELQRCVLYLSKRSGISNENLMHVSVLLRPRSTTPKLSVIKANGLELYLTYIKTVDITGIAFGWNLGFLEAWCGATMGLKSAQIRSCWQLQFLIPTKRRQSCKSVDYGFFAFSCIVEVEPLMGREFSKNSHFLDWQREPAKRAMHVMLLAGTTRDPHHPSINALPISCTI